MDAEEASSPAADDSEAIHLQIVQEASQSEGAETTVDESFDLTDDHEARAALADLADVAMAEDVEQEEETEEEEEAEGEEEDEEEDMVDDEDEDEIPAAIEISEAMAAVTAEGPSTMTSSDELELENPQEMPPPPPEKSSMENIVSALRGGLAELSTAALSRDEVNRIEDMFYDIKRELYNAESRGRALNSQPR